MPRALIPRHPRYTIVRRLGKGGMGSVYLARDRLDGGREVALKVCHFRVAPDQIVREFHVLRELEHPAIARAFDFGRLPGDGRTYFTLEYAAGPNLESQSAEWRKRDRRGTAALLLRVFAQVTAALAYVHRRGLLHLDIKPANIVLAAGRAKLIDFGLFEVVDQEGVRRPRGTAYFTAPEVFAGRAIDRRTDLYSLGVTFYRALTGRHPFSGRSIEEIAERHQHAAPPSLRAVSPQLASVVLKLLAKSPRQRFQSADELLEALRALIPESDREELVSSVERPLFVGRRPQLDAFLDWLGDGRRAPPGPVFLVDGGGGAGKSRFVEICSTELLATGTQVLSAGSPSEVEFETVARLVEQVSLLRPPTAGERTRFAFLFTRLGLASRKDARREIARLELEQIRERVLRDTLAYMGSALATPTVLIVEDVHRRDGQTLELLRRLARRVPEPAAAGAVLPRVLATGRPGPATRSLAAEDGVTVTSLPPLTRDEARDALASLHPPLERASAERIATACRGNPGLLVQLARSARRGEEPAPRSSAADDALRHLLVLRARELDTASRALVLYLALLRSPAGERLLRKLAGFGPRAFADARDEVVRAGLAYVGQGGLALVQDLSAEPVSALFDAEQVREAHERIAAVLARSATKRHEAAHHVLRAGRTEDGIELAIEAAGDLEAAGRIGEAATLFAEALEAHGAEPAARRRRLLEHLGDLRARSGHFDAAARCFDELLVPSSGTESVARIRLLRKRGGIHQRQGDGARARALFDEALQGLETVPDLDEHLHVLNELASLDLFSGEFARSTSLANRGLEMLRSGAADELSDESRALHGLNLHSIAGHILLRQFAYDRAAEELRCSFENAERVGSLSSSALILNNLGIAYHQANRLDRALDVYRRASALAQRMGEETAVFSIQCNLATIRARLGEVDLAREILAAIEEMPHHHRSRRARLFFLHSRGLVERLLLRDARSIWAESIRLADELPDPLFAAYERLYLFENEIDQGRWGSARELLEDLRRRNSVDAGFSRALDLRHAHLEALCGHGDLARALLAEHSRRFDAAGSHMPSYAELWDETRAASALMELGELERARSLLAHAREMFARSGQPAGALECALQLADAALRACDARAAQETLRDAREWLAKHDSSQGSRMFVVRAAFLEVRLAMLGARRGRRDVEDRVAGAAGNLLLGGSQEIGWLLELAAAEYGVAGAGRRLKLARDQFVAGLRAEDRAAYLRRDHRVRLGLTAVGERQAPSEPARAGGEAQVARAWRLLCSLCETAHPSRALELILEGSGAIRVVLFVDDTRKALAWRGTRASDAEDVDALRRSALARGTGSCGRGHCIEVPRPGGRAGVLYLEWAPDREPDPRGALEEFLPLAVRVLAPIVAAAGASAPPAVESTPSLRGDVTRTRSFGEIVCIAGESSRMQEVLTLLRRTRESELPLLLIGESGAGKDHLARWAHALGPRRERPFLGLDCLAIPEALIEADLFGYEKGAFTGADQRRRGYLVEADGGTLYLDNVDSLSLETQAKILRAIETQRVRPLGGTTEEDARARYTASSQRDLKELCVRGEFRADLYYRLAGICVLVPPLRDRPEDIPLLIEHFQRQVAARALRFDTSALEALREYSWPGNVRELESLVRRAALTAEGTITRDDIQRMLGVEREGFAFPRWIFEGRSFEDLVRDLKREYLIHLFESCDGDVSRIAAELGTSKRNVYLRFSQVGLRPVDLRSAR